ncbi:hypothetical protein C3941_23655 [Kaistia algarum]|uniref:hypothetical protein n=1 Tax=Kaistia algarum TaxID=2083279 RepID=UPI000CE82AE7|nr:hypothetical protein [Kaistia algarum]MCX5513445.1 hypothetical protein [Kaistia algarum]PPE77456.1 hypothetical protein C3941_23655 [Kaistia algarum]
MFLDSRHFAFAPAPRPKPVKTPVEIARKLGPAAMTKLMAAEMVEQVALKGDCKVDDLRALGFTAGEITELHFDARQRAGKLFVREQSAA